MDNNQLDQHFTKKEKYELHREQKLAEQNRLAQSKTMKKAFKIILISLVTGLMAWAIWYIVTRPTIPRTNRDVALACTTDMATQFHIHPHLEILINGEREEIPANIGVRPICMNALHTHDTSGTIHVESPEQRDFTLADLFAVWDKPFNQNQILDHKTDSQHAIKETVNGKEVFDYENTILNDGDQIVITYEEIKGSF